MKINQADIKISGSHLQGYLDISYKSLVSILGEPLLGSGDKNQVEWHIEDNGVIATIYDWKDYRNPKDIDLWNIGGFNQKALILIKKLTGKNPISY